MRRLVLPILVLVVASCGSRLRVTSTPPDLQINAQGTNDRKERQLGRTPLNIPMSDLKSFQGDYVKLDFFKPGYEAKSVLIPKVSSSELDFQVDLEKGKFDSIPLDKANEAIKTLFEVQQAIIDKRYVQAEALVQKVYDLNPGLIQAYVYDGTVNFLLQRYAKSLSLWQEVLRLDPNNTQAYSMISQIRGKAPGLRPQGPRSGVRPPTRPSRANRNARSTRPTRSSRPPSQQQRSGRR